MTALVSASTKWTLHRKGSRAGPMRASSCRRRFRLINPRLLRGSHYRQSIASRDSRNYLAFSAEQSDPCHHRGNYREKENPNDIVC